MNIRNTKQIFDDFFSHAYPLEIVEKVQRWMIAPEGMEGKEMALQELWNQLEVEPDQRVRKSFKQVRSRIGIRMSPAWYQMKTWRIAAGILPVIIVLAGYFYLHPTPQMVEIVTLNNERKHSLLPDGSSVWLNSGSVLCYKAGFDDSVRLLTLKGEASFMVKPDKKRPFIVNTIDFQVKALGTVFNVCAYQCDSRSVATLSSGKIQVDMLNNSEEKCYILKPNQQIIYYKESGKVAVDTIIERENGWKEGQLIFHDATFPDIINTLQRYFDVSIIYSSRDFKSDVYSVKFIDGENISQILDVLQDVVGFSCEKIKNRSYKLKIKT